MTSQEHFEAWQRHNWAAENVLAVIADANAMSTDVLTARAVLAQAHATLAHTHAYLMVEGLT